MLLRELMWIASCAARAEDNGFAIELVGKIANMVRVSVGADCLGAEPYRSPVKVVAGVGFEPTTFRL
jgi:hypothetical protein